MAKALAILSKAGRGCVRVCVCVRVQSGSGGGARSQGNGPPRSVAERGGAPRRVDAVVRYVFIGSVMGEREGIQVGYRLGYES